MVDNTIITNPGDIILIKIGKEKNAGFYARINDVTADTMKRNFWHIKFVPIIIMKEFKLIEIDWLLDDNQIRGQEFTMKGVPHQLFKVEFPEEVKFVINHKDKNSESLNDLSNLELVNANAPVPLPGGLKFPNINNIKKQTTTTSKFSLVVNNQNPIRDSTKTHEKPDLKLV